MADETGAQETGAEGAWAPVRRLRAHDQVMAQIEERILAGQLSAGDHLPSERELSALLGVSRPSLRESIRVLEALGIVEVRRGGGPEGGSLLVSEPGEGLVNLLKLQLALGHFTPLEVLQTRVTLETWAVAEAARRSTAEDHRALEELLELMERDDVPMTEFNRLDAAFHVLIAESSGNSLTAHLMSSLRLAINRQMVEAYESLPDWRTTAATVRAEHRAILAAIRAGDGAAASGLVKEHIESFYSRHGALGH